MLLFKLKSQNACKWCGFCPHQKRWRGVSLHLPHEPVWRSRRFLEVTGIFPFSSAKAFFKFSFFPQQVSFFQQIISIQNISKCLPWSVAPQLSLPPSLQAVLTYFSHSYCWKSFSGFQGRQVHIVDDSRPARGKGGASHQMSAQASRKLGRKKLVVLRVPQSQETVGGKYWHPNTSF